MNIAYQFVADEDYFRTVIDRYYRQRPVVFWLPIQYGLIAVPLLCVWLYVWLVGSGLAVVVGLILLAWPLVTLGFVQLTKWGIVQRFRSNSDFDGEVMTVLSEEGIEARGRHSQSKIGWAAYPSAARFSDGILLIKPGAIRWLPDNAIQSGTSQDATSLVEVHTKVRYFLRARNGA